MNETQAYHHKQSESEHDICESLFKIISTKLKGAENKIWHAHPVWFLDGNPIVGYSKQKAGIRLMFWSGASFEEDLLLPGTGKFKDASIFYTDKSQIKSKDLHRWLEKAKVIQWDYKNVVKRRGRLEKIS